MKGRYKILAINPGSTSTKIAFFENSETIHSVNIKHSSKDLDRFDEVNDQLEYRKELILKEAKALGMDLKDIDAFAGRGGGVVPVKSGTYEINETLVEHCRIGIAGQHPAQLAPQICYEFANTYGGKAYVVNPPDVDEFDEIARITGLAEVFRGSRIHALNQKEVALRYCASSGIDYNSSNLVICHLGGGVSITAHKKGRMVDSNDIINQDGPMAPTRSGAIPAVTMLKLCFSGKYTEKELYDKLTKTGGLVDHLGVSDAREIEKRIEEGDDYSKLVYDAMIYQICKSIGSMAAVLQGKVDAIILTGGMANSKYLVGGIRKSVNWIAPISVMAGEFEMEALANGVLRVLRGQEEALEYTGIPVWNGLSVKK